MLDTAPSLVSVSVHFFAERVLAAMVIVVSRSHRKGIPLFLAYVIWSAMAPYNRLMLAAIDLLGYPSPFFR